MCSHISLALSLPIIIIRESRHMNGATVASYLKPDGHYFGKWRLNLALSQCRCNMHEKKEEKLFAFATLAVGFCGHGFPVSYENCSSFCGEQKKWKPNVMESNVAVFVCTYIRRLAIWLFIDFSSGRYCVVARSWFTLKQVPWMGMCRCVRRAHVSFYREIISLVNEQ